MAGNAARKADEHFAFGANWRDYAEGVTEGEIARAIEGLSRLAGGSDSLAGKTFFDIGCGSGIHSLAALRLGAARVLAIDYDPDSVATTEKIAGAFPHGGAFMCRRGDILTGEGLPAGETFDVVYSWGVLHHTGRMWQAVENAAKFVRPGGTLIIALYVKTQFCKFWEREKFYFKDSPHWLQSAMTWVYSALCVMRLLAKGENPVAHIREYNKNRGMSWWHDRIDWLGGWPYESASAAEVEEFLGRKGFKLVRSFDTAPPVGVLGTGCGEYVFVKEQA